MLEVKVRQKEIHDKGFAVYNKVKVNNKTIENITLTSGLNKTIESFKFKMLSKENILKALGCRDLKSLRAASEFYYSVSGVYQRVCDYAANIYRFDWFLTPEVENDYNEDKVLKQFKKILTYLDNSYIKKLCGDIALSVIIKGCYYGVLVPADDRILLQELPINYCRSLYNISGCPAVEFNMKYFDENFTDTTYRNRVLKMFPVDF